VTLPASKRHHSFTAPQFTTQSLNNERSLQKVGTQQQKSRRQKWLRASTITK